jgi:hypothetical protein
VTGITRAPHGNPTGFPRLAFRDPEGSQLLLLPLRLLRQSLIDHLRDTVQSPYLLHPHNNHPVKKAIEETSLPICNDRCKGMRERSRDVWPEAPRACCRLSLKACARVATLAGSATFAHLADTAHRAEPTSLLGI